MNSGLFTHRLKSVMVGQSNLSFAEKCGLSEGTLRSYLKGKTSPPLDTLVIIAKAGNVDLAWLATGEGEMRRGEVGTSAGQVLESAAGRMVQTQQCTPIRPEIAELVELLDNYANKTLLEDLKSKLLNIKKVMEG